MRYAFGSMRAGWNESLNVFYVQILNRFGKHYVIGLRLGLRLEWTAGASALGVCYHRERLSFGFS